MAEQLHREQELQVVLHFDQPVHDPQRLPLGDVPIALGQHRGVHRLIV